MDMPIDAFIRACGVTIAAEQDKVSPDNALIGLLCDAVRLANEREQVAPKGGGTSLDLEEISAWCATFCAHCGKHALAYPGARFCGAPCSHQRESDEEMPQPGKLRAVCLGLAAEMRKVLRLQHEAEWKLSRVAEELKAELQTTQSLRAKLTMVATKIDNVWMWQGDGGNHAASLSCPVIMDAETAYALEQRAEKSEALVEAATTYGFNGPGGRYVAALSVVGHAWVVGPAFSSAPGTQYDSREAAIAEAKRLAGVAP